MDVVRDWHAYHALFSMQVACAARDASMPCKLTSEALRLVHIRFMRICKWVCAERAEMRPWLWCAVRLTMAVGAAPVQCHQWTR